ncbi:50S ribosomal protein L17 [Patescibacteria group bacterium]|nr:50S ribosomal protein L17 [Patescibacteria group bacterium]MBU1246802.1 50S ribosomal protein L17 [Patescibacteria group bacterium]MBU1729955.1 50S ribosomal protein L17 [Patescibacteria group bacterium]MBU1956515.1 50S ribosomal protein L17 [Patescibacteria group bacterium]MBU2010410.1 50S ribosomal protein L17 [Patescibacteria group bacterium]
MRHHVKNRKFGRKTDERKALKKSLAYALIKNEKIKTTEAKAKELRPFIEKLITKGRKNTLASRRIIASRLGDEGCAKKLCDEIALRYKERNGGYTRIIKLPARASDASKMAVIEFV